MHWNNSLAGIRAALFIQPPTPAQLKQIPRSASHWRCWQNPFTFAGGNGTRAETCLARAEKARRAARSLQSLLHVRFVAKDWQHWSRDGCGGENFSRAFHSAACRARRRWDVTRFSANISRATVLAARAKFIGSTDIPPSANIQSRRCRKPTCACIWAGRPRRQIALFDILKIALPEKEARAALKEVLAEKPDAVLFDALYPDN